MIFVTAIIGVLYARYEGFNTLKSGMSQLLKNEAPIYEMLSGASIAIAALLLIIPGFVTDLFGFLLLTIPLLIIIVLLITFFNQETYSKNFHEEE